MKFETLYKMLNEVPHFEVIDTMDMDGVQFVDYKVETWPIDFNLKSDFVNILRKFNDFHLFPIVREGSVHIVDGKGTSPLFDHPKAMEIVSDENMNVNMFSNVIITNYNKFEFV